MSKIKLYFDLDGVLVDFNHGFRKLSNGKTIKQFLRHNEQYKARNLFLSQPSSFWTKLPWTKNGRRLYDYINKMGCFDIWILSSAGTTDLEKAKPVTIGKLGWIKKNIPDFDISKVIITLGRAAKQNHVSKDAILIDDMPDTILKWIINGGIGILHSVNNVQKTYDRIRILKRHLAIGE